MAWEGFFIRGCLFVFFRCFLTCETNQADRESRTTKEVGNVS
jgi:hypothetical protein